MAQHRTSLSAPDLQLASTGGPLTDCAAIVASTVGPSGLAHRVRDSNRHSYAVQAADMLSHAEPLVAISTAHLKPATRQALADGGMSVLAYPNDYGGFVYVGPASENVPQEPELAAIFAIASCAGIVWIKFDADAAVVQGLPVFDDSL